MNRESHRPAGERREPESGGRRRDFIRTPFALAAGSLLGGLAATAKADGKCGSLMLAPRYFPLMQFNPQIDLNGKLAVITGASRGNGRAVGRGAGCPGRQRDRHLP
jgi:hypothetical protein